MHNSTQQHEPRTAISAWQQVVIFLLACAVVISRRPDVILHAQFYAEDAHVWFADAYNLGWWRALFNAQDGYFQTVPRLGAALALLAPMARAPLVMNAIAIAVQVLPVNLLFSPAPLRGALYVSVRVWRQFIFPFRTQSRSASASPSRNGCWVSAYSYSW